MVNLVRCQGAEMSEVNHIIHDQFDQLFEFKLSVNHREIIHKIVIASPMLTNFQEDVGDAQMGKDHEDEYLRAER